MKVNAWPHAHATHDLQKSHVEQKEKLFLKPQKLQMQRRSIKLLSCCQQVATLLHLELLVARQLGASFVRLLVPCVSSHRFVSELETAPCEDPKRDVCAFRMPPCPVCVSVCVSAGAAGEAAAAGDAAPTAALAAVALPLAVAGAVAPASVCMRATRPPLFREPRKLAHFKNMTP